MDTTKIRQTADDFCQALEAKEGELNERAAGLDLRRKNLEEGEAALEAHEKSVECGFVERERVVKNREDSASSISTIAANRKAEIEVLKDQLKISDDKRTEAAKEATTAKNEQRRIEGVLTKTIDERNVAERALSVVEAKLQYANETMTRLKEILSKDPSTLDGEEVAFVMDVIGVNLQPTATQTEAPVGPTIEAVAAA